MAGYFLSEKMCAGLMLEINYDKQTIAGNPDVVDYSHLFVIAPFFRYFPVEMNKFAVYLQATAGLVFSGSSTKSGGTTNEGPTGTHLGIMVNPGLEYKLNDKITLETGLNFLSLGYTLSNSKQTVGNTDITTKNSSFTFGAGLDNIINVGAITIGAYYRFKKN